MQKNKGCISIMQKNKDTRLFLTWLTIKVKWCIHIWEYMVLQGVNQPDDLDEAADDLAEADEDAEWLPVITADHQQAH